MTIKLVSKSTGIDRQSELLVGNPKDHLQPSTKQGCLIFWGLCYRNEEMHESLLDDAQRDREEAAFKKLIQLKLIEAGYSSSTFCVKPALQKRWQLDT